MDSVWIERRHTWFNEQGVPLGAHIEQPDDMRLSDNELKELQLKPEDLSLEASETVNYDEQAGEQATLSFDQIPEDEYEAAGVSQAVSWLTKLSGKEQAYQRVRWMSC